MNTLTHDCCILNGGNGGWAFEPLARQLSAALGVDISAEPRRFNYLLHLEHLPEDFPHQLFIPLSAIQVASDKRLAAAAFAQNDVPTPRTVLIDLFSDVLRFVAGNQQ